MSGFTRSLVCSALFAPALATQTTATIEGPPFPGGEIALIASVTIFVSVLISAVAGWKGKLIEHALESSFERSGACIGFHPLKTCLGAVLITVVLGAGFPMKKAETDPAVLWVPSGSIVLDHRDYVENAWSSELFPVFVYGSPKDGNNVLTASDIQALYSHQEQLMNITVDGTAIVEVNKATKDYTAEMGGLWTFDGRAVGGEATRKLCFEFQPNACGLNSLLTVFGNDASVISGLNDASINSYLAAWDDAAMNSVVNGQFKSFQLSDVLGGLRKDSGSNTYTADVARTTLFFNFEALPDVKAHQEDEAGMQSPLNLVWEASAVCQLGIEEKQPITKEECTPPETIEYTGFFTRSFKDEFGEAILGDISRVAMSYVLIFLYLLFMLGKWDLVWSKLSLSVVVLFVVGFSFTAANGICGYIGVKENPLNNNIPFLLLGLGVDDAFVLSSEFARHTVNHPELSVTDRIAMTARTGGVSVLVTSATDALAFLIGASTRLPALSAFCIYAGFGVSFCFVYIMIFFLPWLAIDAWRAEGNRFDCCCCFRARTEHKITQPQGLCPCIPGCSRVQPDHALSRSLEKFGNFVVKSPVGKGITLVSFLALFAVGVSGVGQLEKEFKIEWFFPEGSYFEEFSQLNTDNFRSGEIFDVYMSGVDFHAEREQVDKLSSYLAVQEHIVSGSIDNWWTAFASDTPTYASLSRQDFFRALHDWYLAAPNSRYRSEIQWRAAACSAACSDADAAQGVEHAKIKATMKDFSSGKMRYEVYRTYREDMKELFNDETGKRVFPYTQAFLYWEENGIIDVELVRNLIISCGVIFTIIAALVPHPRVAILVGLNICAAIAEIIGFAHYWGVTMNGVSTIYFLICVGLSVDYSVHVAHTFTDSPGDSQDRAVNALARIGPSTFNAVVSTILAVVVLASSKSFVFEVFFKILCLVSVIAGGHGLWLLPVLLGMLGGSPKEVGEPVASSTVDNPLGDASAKHMVDASPTPVSENAIGA
jgi:predicted RND superfamily exporter protein